MIPGISSAIAAPAYAGIPVTHREHTAQLTIFTGHEDPTKTESSLDFAQLAATPGTKVMLMGVERIGAITGEVDRARRARRRRPWRWCAGAPRAGSRRCAGRSRTSRSAWRRADSRRRRWRCSATW